MAESRLLQLSMLIGPVKPKQNEHKNAIIFIKIVLFSYPSFKILFWLRNKKTIIFNYVLLSGGLDAAVFTYTRSDQNSRGFAILGLVGNNLIFGLNHDFCSCYTISHPKLP